MSFVKTIIITLYSTGYEEKCGCTLLLSRACLELGFEGGEIEASSELLRLDVSQYRGNIGNKPNVLLAQFLHTFMLTL